MKRTTAADRTALLQAKIELLGGTIPAPWPWAIIRKRGTRTLVDAPLYNLQLLELVEDLEKAQHGQR